MTEKYEGGCHCGNVRFAAAGAPVLVEFCHCESCRKASGAPIFAWAAFPADRFALSRGTPRARRSSDTVARAFCPDCGTPLTLADDRFPEEIYAAAGAFDDPDALPPAFHIWRGHRLSWCETADTLPRYKRFKYQGELE